MQAQADQGVPEEVCGLLAGEINLVQQLFPVENELHSPVRYRMDPHGQWAAFQEIERRGMELLAIYHSHPLGPAVPSPTDLEEACYPDAVTFILSPLDKVWQGRAFYIAANNYREIPLEIFQ